MKKSWVITAGVTALLTLSACGHASKTKNETADTAPTAVKSNKQLKLFSQVLQSKKVSVWFPIDFKDSFHTQGEGLTTETKVPDIIVVQNGQSIRYTAVTRNTNNGEFADGSNYIKPLDNSLTLGELSKMSTKQIIAKYKKLDEKTF